MIDIKKYLKKLKKIGFGQVFSAFAINKIIAFVTNFLIVRFLTKSDYGLFSSAFNIYSFFNVYTGLGMLSSELLFCTEKRSPIEKKAIYKYTLLCGFFADVIMGIVMIIYGMSGFIALPESRPLIIQFAGLLVFEYIMQYFLVYYRTKIDNKKFSVLSIINSSLYLLFGSLGAVIFGATGTIVGRYLAMIIPIMISLYWMKNDITDIKNKERISNQIKTEVWLYATKSGASSFLNHIIYLIDVAIISYIISDSEIIASYKFATLIPEGLIFIPQAIIVTIIPHYLNNINNPKWLRNNTKTLFWGMAIFNLFITIGLIVATPLIVKIIGGAKYADSMEYFRILSISYFFLATFRLFSTNLLAIFRKTTFNLIAAGVNGVINIILDLVLIKFYGATGAAWATTISVILVSFISFPYLLHVIYSKRLEPQLVSKDNVFD